MSEKIKVVIDRAKWRTGGFGEHRTGEGGTSLENSAGYMCCLGFCVKACSETYETRDMCSPVQLYAYLPGLTRCIYDTELGETYATTPLTTAAMRINDDTFDRPEEKESRLLALFEDSPYVLEFVGEYDERKDQSDD